MKAAASLVVAAAAAVAAAARPAAAQDAPPADDVCDDAIVDPAPLGLRAGGFDAPRAACLRGDLDAHVGARALIDTPDFYGTLGGDLVIGVRFVEAGALEWGASLRVIDATFAQTAVVTSTELGYGPLSLHAAVGAAPSPRLHLAAALRLEVPPTRSDFASSIGGAQLAGLATWGAHPRVALHGRLGLLGWYGSSPGGTTTRGAVLGSVDAAVRAIAWLDVLVGAEVQGGWYGGFDHVAARLGAHWRLLGPWRLEVAAAMPLAGDERTDVALLLGLRRDR